MHARLGDFEIKASNQGQVFADDKYKKNEMMLLPLGSLLKVPEDKVQKNQISIKKKDMKGFVYVIQGFKCDFAKETGWFCPFWMVKEAETKDDACLARSTLKINDMVVPCYTNKVALKSGDLLLLEPKPDNKRKLSQV